MAAPQTEQPTEPSTGPDGHIPPRRRITSLEVLCAVLVLALLAQAPLVRILDIPAVRTGATVFVAVCVQAMPFLVLGVLVSGVITAFVPPAALRRVLPRKPAAAVPVAGAAGMALPGCECASVPVSRRLMQQGVPPAAALAFLLAAPAVNPVVLVATAVAFPGEPRMVLARFLGSMGTALVMGWLWARFGRLEWIAENALRRSEHPPGRRPVVVFLDTARHDLVSSGGFLVLGGLTAAALNVLVPASWMAALAGQVLLGILVMALLAVVLALCSEADAFVAASLSAVPLLPRLVFLVVGPAVDVKLMALQAGTFGRGFASRFAPATFVVAIGCAVLAGVLVLGGVR
ncbi:MAG: permease [Actinomycetota bacterium]|nr:permease [Actinomycetota bacterium]